MAMEAVEERMSTFMQAGFGWTLSRNHALVLEMVDYQPLGGRREFVYRTPERCL